MTPSQPNPYEPPASPDLGIGPVLPVLPENRWCEVDVKLVSVHRGWWKRRIRIAGSVEADIEYDPRGNGERVLVNGRVVVQTSPWGWRIVQPHIEFELETYGFAIPASIDVKASLWRLLKTCAFRLVVAGKTIYEE